MLKSAPNVLPLGQPSSPSPTASPGARNGHVKDARTIPPLSNSICVPDEETSSRTALQPLPRSQSRSQSQLLSVPSARSSPSTQWDESTVTFESDADRNLSTPATSEDGFVSNGKR